MSSHDLIFCLDFKKWRPAGDIVEIGSQRHGGKGSSFELRRLANTLGVRFSTVDFSSETYANVKGVAPGVAYHADGEQFLREYTGMISILHLDNYDVAYNSQHYSDLKSRVGDLYGPTTGNDDPIIKQNVASAKTHYEQLLAAMPLLTSSAVVACDDTFFRSGSKTWLGKGALVVPFLVIAGFIILETSKNGVLLGRGLSFQK